MSEIQENNKNTHQSKIGFLGMLKKLPLIGKVIIAFLIVVIIAIIIIINNIKNNSDSVKYGVTLKSEQPTAVGAKQVPISIPDQLTDVQSKLSNIVTLVANPGEKPDITAIKLAVDNVNNELETIKTEDQTRYNALMDKITSLSSQLVANQKSINKNFNELESLGQHKKCYPASSLSFQVRSIDLINGRIVVSIFYDNQITPLEKDFTLAGWTLTSANYNTQTANFTDVKNRCVQVNLNTNF